MSAPAQVIPVDFERQRAVCAALRGFMPEHSVLFEREDVTPYECDGLSAYRQVPMVVALPENEEQVCAILETCHEMHVPVTARGAGTGLSGGALPLGFFVQLSRAHLDLHADDRPQRQMGRVHSARPNLETLWGAAPYGLYYAPDPSSQIACSIGGNVAENSGGVHCLKYGLTVHNILKLRVATIEGEIIELGGGGLDAAGYDLMALMTGSEGLLGVVTAYTVTPMPPPRRSSSSPVIAATTTSRPSCPVRSSIR